MKRRTKTELPEASINLTSLLDITFVLLISFMIVAPTVKYNVDLDLPKSSDVSNTDAKKPITIQVARETKANSSVVYVNGREVPADRVGPEIKSLPSYSATAAISLEADREVPWEDMAQLISHLTANDITNLGIITEKASR